MGKETVSSGCVFFTGVGYKRRLGATDSLIGSPQMRTTGIIREEEGGGSEVEEAEVRL